MSNIFNPIYYKNNEVLFYIYLAIIFLIVLITIYLVYKELRKNKK